MRYWIRLLIAVVIVNLTIGAARWVYAQAGQAQAPLIITGSDVGFRVDQSGTRELGKLRGTWVVRYNGQWVEPESILRPLPLSTR
jgi:hypothetical protein